jgi:ectoine hydroxylase-related dioxygenase (phytanoyl-CoA dioxygenase family)
MFYLVDTSPQNGCLRVIPRSHHTSHPLHLVTSTGHDGDVRHQDPSTSLAYTNYPEQVDVSVRAGDLVIGDARLLHAANANRSDQRRTVITMWYMPRYESMSEPLLAAYQSRLFVPPPEDLPVDQQTMIEPFLPNYTGDATPTPWDRIPARLLEEQPG